ncbi:MAG TPA: crotonase [Thermococcus sp.]|nr:crotonase [Thermococcus sp.]
MAREHISFEVEGKIGIAILNRPEVGNAFDWITIKEMNDILHKVEHDEGIGGLIIAAKGNKYFCVGADIKLMQSIDGKEYAEFLVAGLRMNEKIQRCRKPTIAAINGWAVGAGCEIAMSCDLRIASTNARIGIPELKIGLIPGWGGVFRLARIVGQAKALEMVLTASNISAEEAKEAGLVNKVVEPESLMTEAKSLMQKILTNAPIAIALAKQITRSAFEVPFYAGESYEAMVSILTFLSKDGKEGMEAFFQKRSPCWKGR